MLLSGWGRIGIEVGDADCTYRLAAVDAGAGSGRYFIGGREARPVAPATDAALQDELWARWERETGQAFEI